ncbi:hypothetical protein TrispH2_004880 [Trichoplax sp. H2]|nr:hypothetical protein TrispH2_004880 [Trichoplax sp. H2]|eukprot:RDD42897.1 hypothetical protein TrispH2_004880 [Trichoplax sp. H2]
MEYDVSSEAAEMLQNFALCVLRNRPGDLYSFAAEYFTKLSENMKEQKKLREKEAELELDKDENSSASKESGSVYSTT